MAVSYYSTNDPKHRVSVRDAVMQGLARDGGLYMPVQIEPLPRSFWSGMHDLSYTEVAFEMLNPFFNDGLSTEVMLRIIERVCQIPVKVIEVNGAHIVELFHGPTHAFKDVGARFMAELLAAYQQFEEQDLHILVATSGDTGGAVAAAFQGHDGIRVSILYPSGGVSELQEKQLTTWGDNIQAIQVNGSFDDCQRMVKSAFTNEDLRNRKRLTSANSINIGRWLPQSIYYAEAIRQMTGYTGKDTFVVPSGNLGNLSAGMVAARLGLQVGSWLASTNANDVVPVYLERGIYQSKPVIHTLANAMDVGSPSNFIRMQILGGSTWNNVKRCVKGMAIQDSSILDTIRHVHDHYGYILDPHTATAWHMLKMSKDQLDSHQGMHFILSTAHPSKFESVIQQALGFKPDLAPDLMRVQDLSGSSIKMEAKEEDLLDYLCTC